MKLKTTISTTLSVCFLLLLTVFSSCKKDTQKDNEPKPEVIYQNIKAGSTWTYSRLDNSDPANPNTSQFTITSTNRDTSINGRTYHIYDYSFGGHQYLSKLGTDYMRFDTLPAGLSNSIELLYLKDKSLVGTTWTQDFNVQVPDFPLGTVPITLQYEILDIGPRTVNGKTYSDVIHVKTTIASNQLPVQNFTNNIDSYYAPNVGLIENTTVMNIQFMNVERNVDMKTTLVEANLQ
ncbi:MAG: hypothetical protein J5I50_00670 [Chitinophagaceae bacterium]|nr:hypothetical protein [Chitinophagaceae bacterium]